MRELRSGWDRTRVGDLFDMQIGKKLNKEASAGLEQYEYVTNKDVQWNRIHFKALNRMSFSVTERERFRLLPDDLLVTEGGEVGRTAIWEGQRTDCYFQMSLHRLRTRGAIEPRYMLHYMAYAARHGLFVDGVSQTSIAHLPQDKFAEHRVAHPVELDEQRRIVEAIDATVEQERTIEASIAKLRKIRKGVMLSLLGLPRGAQGAQGGVILPSGWVVSKLGDLFEMQLGKMLSKDAVKGRDLRPYLTNRNVQWGRIELDDLGQMQFSPAEQKRFGLLPGDLVVTEGGEVGRAAIWDGRVSDCYFQKSLHRLRSKGVIEPRFMLYYMEFAAWSGLLVEHTVQTSIAHLPQERFCQLAVAHPRDISEQLRIVAAIESCDDRIEGEQMALAKLRTLRLGLVDDLLAGVA